MLLDYAFSKGYNIIHINDIAVKIVQYNVSAITETFNATLGGFSLMVADYLKDLDEGQVEYDAKAAIEVKFTDGEHDLLVYGDNNVQVPFTEEIGTLFNKIGNPNELFMIIRIYDKYSFSYIFVFRHILL